MTREQVESNQQTQVQLRTQDLVRSIAVAGCSKGAGALRLVSHLLDKGDLIRVHQAVLGDKVLRVDVQGVGSCRERTGCALKEKDFSFKEMKMLSFF